VKVTTEAQRSQRVCFPGILVAVAGRNVLRLRLEGPGYCGVTVVTCCVSLFVTLMNA